MEQVVSVVEARVAASRAARKVEHLAELQVGASAEVHSRHNQHRNHTALEVLAGQREIHHRRPGNHYSLHVGMCCCTNLGVTVGKEPQGGWMDMAMEVAATEVVVTVVWRVAAVLAVE